ncbi:YfhO family protein [Streptomyces sp. NBC_01506]|uniref:YfhO family protein n=1 Tax=Streptomyces sp. NBC_01506 TaxID=2903887 RepID=UPI0038644453
MPTLESARGRAAAFAGLITVIAVCSGDAVARSFPFGSETRSVNDLGNQFVPFHAKLWDLLHGRGDGGPLLNWQSGYGTSFLPDLGTYLTSPFALLVGLFPRDRIDLAVYVITVLKMAAAGAAMAWLLLSMAKDATAKNAMVKNATAPRRPTTAPWWAAGALGATYALCGWSVIEASYNPMWLDGLIAFPLLCLVGEWVRAGRRPVLGPLVVALAWVANFYTAYMATLGAVLVLVVRLLLHEGVPRERLRVLVRGAVTVLLGIGLAAPVLLPVVMGTRHAYPGWTTQFKAAGWSEVFARTLPATYDFFTPAVFLGGGALLLAAALPFNRAVPGRERAAWAGLAGAVALSLQWGPTHLVWHAFATPNGSPFRQTFVLSGLLVIAAGRCLAYGWPGRRALLGGSGVLVALGLVAATDALTGRRALALFACGLAAAVAALLVVRLPRRRYAALAALLLVGGLVGQAAATTAYADRARLDRLDHYPAWDRAHDERADAVARADGWPNYRTDPGRTQITANDPLLLGGQGSSYYSSHTPEVLTRTLGALGAGWTSNGRAVQSLDNPVVDAVFTVGARLRTEEPQESDGPSEMGGGSPKVIRADVPPLVTVRPPERTAPRYGASPFRNQELLLGSRVYSSPVAGACPVGREVFLWAPDYYGTARLGDARPVELRGDKPRWRAAVTSLGVAERAGERVTFDRKAPRARTVACLDRTRLSAAVGRMTRTGAVSVRVSDHGVRAQLPPGSTGTAVIAAPRVAGWSCAGRPADSYLGLVAVPLDPDGTTTSVDCSFRPPGLRSGAALGAVSLLVLAGVAALSVRRRRREGMDPAAGQGPGQDRGQGLHVAGAAPELLPTVEPAP